MNLYNAAQFTNGFHKGQKTYTEKFNDRERAIFDGMPYILDSYHYIKRQRFVDEIRAAERQVFLDSGAFSSFASNIEVDIDAYCEYISANTDIIKQEDGIVMASVLDAIGDAHGTYENQLYMERKGTTPLPCFHFGEDVRYLEWYVENYQYLTLGGMVPISNKQNIIWLDEIWNKYLTDGAGRPKLKVHAFGVTSLELMRRYPWHSVDSSSAVQYSIYGHVFTTEHGPVTLSEKSPARHTAGKHVENYTTLEREYMLKYFADRDFDYERLQTTYEARVAASCYAYIKLGEILDKQPTPMDYRCKQTLF